MTTTPIADRCASAQQGATLELAPESPAVAHEPEPDLESFRDRLSVGDRQRLDDEGYIVLAGQICPAWVEQLRLRVEALSEEEGPGGFHENKVQGIGRGMLADLVNKGEVFDGVWTHPLVLSASLHAIGPSIRLFALNYRDPLPGEGHQQLHRDTSGANVKLQCICCLDDFTPDNGSTRMVPRSHRDAALAAIPLTAEGDHPHQIMLSAPSGSMIIYHGDVLHSGTRNRGGARRRSLIQSYVPRTYPQLCNQAEYLRVSTARRLTTFHRWLLDT